MKATRTIRCAMGVLLLAPTAGLAEAGRVLLAVGEVVAERAGRQVALARGAAVEQGDTIRTGPASNAQLRLSDGAILSLGERTQLRIDEHVFTGRIDGSERSFVTLLAGALRKVTGAIGNLRRDDKYGVRTATASIGIRGTHYTLRECNDLSPCPAAGGRAALEVAQAPGQASDAPGVLAQAAPGGQFAPPGTYGGISDGRIGVRNEAGESEFGARQFFYVADRFTLPQGLIAPPPFLYDRLPGQQRSAGQRGVETGEYIAGGFDYDGIAEGPPLPSGPSEFVATEERDASGGPAVLPTLPPVVGVAGALFLDEYGPGDGGGFALREHLTLSGFGPAAKLLGFLVLPENLAEPEADFFVAGVARDASAVINETRPNPIGAIWGRWLAGQYVESNGQSFSVEITPYNQLHYLGGPPTPPEVIAARTGSFSMADAGGTTPTNNLGETGAFRISGAQVNFTERKFEAVSVQLTFPSQSWSFGNLQGSISSVAGKGAFVNAHASGTCECSYSGEASLGMTGVFLGPQGNHLGAGFSATSGSAHASTARLLQVSGGPHR